MNIEGRKVALNGTAHFLFTMLGVAYNTPTSIIPAVFPKSLNPLYEPFFRYPVTETHQFYAKYIDLKRSCAFEITVNTDSGPEVLKYFITTKDSSEMVFFEFHFGEKLQSSKDETKEEVTKILNERMKTFMKIFIMLHETHNKQYLLFHIETTILGSYPACLSFFINAYFKVKL